jgi:superfamily II RNA helicase
MGINMPTKTVIFHSLKKFDGSDSDRQLNSSEYVQMSGRAGRRGLDEKGTVIIMVKDPQQLPEPQDMVRMMDSHG